MPTTEQLDTQLVAALCRDGRADIRDIATATETVPTTVQKRLRALEADGTVAGYTALIDYGKLGYGTVIFRLDVDFDAIDDVTAWFRDRKEFVTVYQTCGSGGVFAVGKFGSEAAVAACLRKLHEIPDIQRIDTNTVVSVRLENDCPIPE